MISDGLLLCFKDVPPKTISIINLGANLLEFILLMWGLGGNSFIQQSGLALYIVGMILEILSYSTLIAIHIIILYMDQSNYLILNKVGKIICTISLFPRSLGFLFIFIASIILMAKYNSLEVQLVNYLSEGKANSGKQWGAAIVPFIFIILITLFTVYCLNALYYIFDKNIINSNVRITNSSPQNIINNVNVLEKPNFPYNYEMNPMKDNNNNINNNIDSKNNLYNNPPLNPVNNENAA